MAGTTEPVSLLLVFGGTNNTVDGLTFDGGLAYSPVISNANRVVFISGATNLQMRNNIFRHTRGIALEVDPNIRSDKVTLSNNIFFDIGNYWKTTLVATDRAAAINFDTPATQAATSTNIAVTGNNLSDIGLDPINVVARWVQILGNKVVLTTGPAQWGHLTFSGAVNYPDSIDGGGSNWQVSGNFVTGSIGMCFAIRADNLSISGNGCDSPGGAGILTSGTNVTVTGNTVDNPVQQGPVVGQPSQNAGITTLGLSANYIASGNVIADHHSQFGTVTNGQATIKNLVETSLFTVGNPVLSTYFAGGTTVLSIDSASQITVSNNANATSTQAQVQVGTPTMGYCYQAIGHVLSNATGDLVNVTVSPDGQCSGPGTAVFEPAGTHPFDIALGYGLNYGLSGSTPYLVSPSNSSAAGTAALANTGVTGGTVPLNNGNNIHSGFEAYLNRLLIGTTTAPSGGSIELVLSSASGGGLGGGLEQLYNGNSGIATIPTNGGGANLYTVTGGIGAENYALFGSITNGGVLNLVNGLSLNNTLVISGSNPAPLLSATTSVSGAWPAGVGAYNSLSVLDSSDHRLAGDLAPLLLLSTSSGGAGSYGFSESLSLNCGTKGPVGIAGGNFLTCLEVRANPSNNAGGTSMTATVGSNNPVNSYAILTPGATWWTMNEPHEHDYEVMSGASSLIQTAGQTTRLGQDWGMVGTGADVNAFAGRVGFWITSQQPTYDGTSTASATASAGNNLPAFRSLLPLGGGFQEWLGTSATSFSDTFPQTNPNTNSCTIGVANCPATTAAAAVRPQILGNGFAWGAIHFTNEVWRTPGYVLRAGGEIDPGNGSIKPTTAGLTIDAVGSYVSSATYVSGDQTGHKVGEYLYGSSVSGTVPGAVLQIAAVNGSGVPTSLTVVDPGYSSASAATNNASPTLGTAATFMGLGRNTVAVTWTNITDGTGPTIIIAPTAGRLVVGTSPNAVIMNAGTLLAQNRLTQNGAAAITGYAQSNAPETVSGTNLNPGYLVFGGNGTEEAYGMDLGYNGTYGTRIFAPSDKQITLSHVNGTAAPTAQSSFTDDVVIDVPSNTTTIKTANVKMSSIASSTAALNFLCYNSSTGLLTFDSAGTCLASREDYKDIFERITGDEALGMVEKLHPFWGKYKDSQTGIADHRVHAMLGAHQVESVDPRLASYDGDGKVRAFRDLNPVLVTAIQKQQAEIDALATHRDKSADDPLTPLREKIDRQQNEIYILFGWCVILSGLALIRRVN